ncbi:MAG: hypothetical protein ACFNYB_02190 [Campylobacter sp.]
MLRYIIGGVALAATGYGLKKYLDVFGASIPVSCENKSDIRQGMAESNKTEDLDDFHHNYETIRENTNYALTYLMALQNRLLKTEANKHESKILNLNEIDIVNFKDATARKQISSFLHGPISMICYMMEKSIRRLESVVNDKEDNYKILTEKLIELNNRLTKALKEPQPNINKEISVVYNEVNKIFKEEIHE